MSKVPDSTRRSVLDRDEVCLRCGGIGTDIHHRIRRRDGGHSVENLVLLCRRDHQWVHGNPLKAEEDGWIVPFWGALDTPIRSWYGVIVLASDGTFRRMDE